MKYVLFLNDTEDDYHYGCTATSRAIKDHIRSDCPDFKLVTVTVQEVWRAQCSPTKEDFFTKHRRRQFEDANKRLVELIKGASYIVVNGEGTIFGFDGRSGTQNLLYLINLAEAYGKPIAVINHSAFPGEDERVREIYRRVYSRMTFCAVRDSRSYALLQSLGCRKVRLAFDSSPDYIARLYRETMIPYESGEYICLSGGQHLQKAFPKFLERCATRLAEAFGKKLVFLMSETAVKSQDDLRCLEIIDEFNRRGSVRIEVYRAKDVDEFLTFIKHAFCTITGRFHHSVMATAFRKPFVVYSTHTPKNEVFNTLGAGVFANIDAIEEEDIVDKVLLAEERADQEGGAAASRVIELALENYRHWPLKSRFRQLVQKLKSRVFGCRMSTQEVEQHVMRMAEQLTKEMDRQFQGVWREFAATRKMYQMDERLTKEMDRQFQGVWGEFAAMRKMYQTPTGDKLSQIYQCAAIEHQKVFPKYRNCNKGRDLVILASGPTLDYYNLKQDALYLGVNKSFYANKAPLDYLFVQDYIPSAQNDIDNYEGNHCKKFYGVHYLVPGIAQSHADKAGAERYYFIDNNVMSTWDFPPDVSMLPFNTYSSIVHPAITFALYTGVRRIYLVGCDTSLGGYSAQLGYQDPSKNALYVDYVLSGWKKLKTYAETLFPETEIISVNPVGLKGLFKDVYTKDYLAAHPELTGVKELI